MAPPPPWRLNLQPASFKGVGFKVDVGAKLIGRRLVGHEFPKKNIPFGEDMGRKQRHITVTAYIISGPTVPDYRIDRDALVEAIETEGEGILVLPTMGDQGLFLAGIGSVTESRERGGYAAFEIDFMEFGQAIFTSPAIATQQAVTTEAQSATQSVLASPDISNLSGPTNTFDGTALFPNG